MKGIGSVGLFSKNPPTVDGKLAALIIPSGEHARKQFARVQQTVQQTVDDSEEIRLIGVDLDRWGNPVTVITNRRVLVCKRDQVVSQAPGAVTDLKIEPTASTWVKVIGKPNVDVHFLRIEDANAFMIKLDPRDIPTLYPTAYTSALQRAGKPVTDANVDAIARLAANKVGFGATAYLQQRGDERAMEAFKRVAGGDQYVGHVADKIIDFLWSYSAQTHDVLREIMGSMEQQLTDAVTKYGDQLPADIWHDE